MEDKLKNTFGGKLKNQRKNNSDTETKSDIETNSDIKNNTPSNRTSWGWFLRLNPFRDLFVVNPEKQTFVGKFHQAMNIFRASRLSNTIKPQMKPEANISQAWDYFCKRHLGYAKPGILDWCLLFIPAIVHTFIQWIWAQTGDVYIQDDEEVENNPKKLKFWMWGSLVLLYPLYWLLFIVKNVIALALTIVFSPIIAIVHLFWGPPEKDRKTPLRQSLFFNPSTWIMGALLLAALSLLIFPWANIAVFTQAAAVLGIMQGVFVGMAGLLLVGGLLYTGWRLLHAAGRFFYDLFETDTKYQQSKVVEGNGFKLFLHENPITKYLGERWSAITANSKTSILIWGIGAISLSLIIGFTISYFTGGMISDSVMGQLFDFMSHAFLASVHAIAALPGFEFLNGISDATLLFVGQIVSAVTVCSAVFFITDTISHMLETTGEYLQRERQEAAVEATYEYKREDLDKSKRTGHYLAIVKTTEHKLFKRGDLIWVTGLNKDYVLGSLAGKNVCDANRKYDENVFYGNRNYGVNVGIIENLIEPRCIQPIPLPTEDLSAQPEDEFNGSQYENVLSKSPDNQNNRYDQFGQQDEYSQNKGFGYSYISDDSI